MYRLQNPGRNSRKTNGIVLTHFHPRYIGRFAPSPTGPLHFGSLYTALASYLQARSQNGKWLVRIDDLDTARNVPGATESILKTLEKYGLYWDDRIYFQSQNTQTYQIAIAKLTSKQQLFRCVCTRKILAQHRRTNPKAAIYPGFCKDANHSPHVVHALRIKANTTNISFTDALQGKITPCPANATDNFIVQRRDRVVAYQLAVVIDDYRQNITEVVRGYDLLGSTAKQIYLQQQLDLPTPNYMHVPIIVDARGNKLSKQTFARPIDDQNPGPILHEALRLLRQNPPEELRFASVAETLAWAVTYWKPTALKKTRTLGRGGD